MQALPPYSFEPARLMGTFGLHHFYTTFSGPNGRKISLQGHIFKVRGEQNIWGRGHNGFINCVRTGMSKSVSISKTFLAANAIYSHIFAGHEALVGLSVELYVRIFAGYF